MSNFGFCLEVWGDFACFTRPELKVERMSYDVITPSSARAIYSCILWKPRLAWVIDRIDVLNPIRFISIRRNEVGALATKDPYATICLTDKNKRVQRGTLMLRDVKYRIYAHFDFIRRPGEEIPPEETPAKYAAMFERRASKGQCFRRPYLGCRECSAEFRLVKSPAEESITPIEESRDLGLMLYDLDFSNPKDPQPMFYHAQMEHGVIRVPAPDSEEIKR